MHALTSRLSLLLLLLGACNQEQDLGTNVGRTDGGDLATGVDVGVSGPGGDDAATGQDGAMSCGVCTAPAHAIPTCGTGGCDFACDVGYARSGASCVPGTFGWTVQSSGTSQYLTGVWGSSAGDVYVVGNGGTILHTADSGTTWSAQTSGTTDTLWSVWGNSAGDVYAVGYGGTLLHTTDGGSSWLSMSTGTTADLRSIWGFGTDLYVVSADTTILHSVDRGLTWSASAPSVRLLSVWGSSESDVYAVGNAATDDGSGRILHTTDRGQTWTSIPSAKWGGELGGFSGVWCSPAGVYAVGEQIEPSALIVHSSDGGGAWSQQESQATQLHGVSGASDNALFAVGDGGTIRMNDGKSVTWSIASSGTTQALYAVWASAAGEAYAVGNAGTIVHGHF